MRAQSEVVVLAMVPWEHLEGASAPLSEVLLAWMTPLQNFYPRDHEDPVEQCLSLRVLDSNDHSSGLAGSRGCVPTLGGEMGALDEMFPGCVHSSRDPSPEAAQCLWRAAEVALQHCRSCDFADHRDHGSRKLQRDCACRPFVERTCVRTCDPGRCLLEIVSMDDSATSASVQRVED